MDNNQQKTEQSPRRSIQPILVSQSDFLYFKNQTLKDLKEIEANILSKVKVTTDQYDTKFSIMDSKVKEYSEKIFEFSLSLNEEKNNLERIDKLYEFKSNSEFKITNLEQRIKNITENFNEEIYSLKRTLNESINYPNVIGPKAKFRNFHDFIDYIIKSISTFNLFREKLNVMDMQNYKTKLDKIMKSYKFEIDTYISSLKNFATDSLLAFENKVNANLKILEEKIEKEKNNLQKNIDEIEKKYDSVNTNINSLKDELLIKIALLDDENEKNILNLNSKYDKYFSDLDSVHKKLEEIDANLKKILLEYDDKIKEQEDKFSSKLNDLNNLISSLNYSNFSNTDQKSFDEKNKNKKNLISNLKLIDSSNPLKAINSVKREIKKNLLSEINLNNISSNKDKKVNSRENKRNININSIDESEPKVKSNSSMDKDKNYSIPYINDVKLINFYNEENENSKDNNDNKLFMNRKKIDSLIIDKENFLINKNPKKQMIKNLLKGDSSHISYYIKKNKEGKKNILNKIIYNQKALFNYKKNLDINDYLKERFDNITAQYIKKEKFFDKNSNNNSKDNQDEIEEFIKNNKKIFSSSNFKTRNNSLTISIRHNSRFGYNSTDKIKDKNNTIVYESDKNNNIKSSKTFRQENKIDIKYKKMKMKIINNFNSAFKEYDINMKNEGLSNSRYKLNPINKNKKLFNKK